MLQLKDTTLKAGRQVNTKHVDTLIRNYKQQRWADNSKKLGKEDSMSVWYSIEELEQFLAKAKDHGADGVRLYFGVYGADQNVDPEYVGRQTSVFVATKHKTGNTNKDLYITTENGSTSILAYNLGKLCPPNCGTGSEDGIGIGITIIDKGSDGIVIA